MKRHVIALVLLAASCGDNDPAWLPTESPVPVVQTMRADLVNTCDSPNVSTLDATGNYSITLTTGGVTYHALMGVDGTWCGNGHLWGLVYKPNEVSGTWSQAVTGDENGAVVHLQFPYSNTGFGDVFNMVCGHPQMQGQPLNCTILKGVDYQLVTTTAWAWHDGPTQGWLTGWSPRCIKQVGPDGTQPPTNVTGNLNYWMDTMWGPGGSEVAWSGSGGASSGVHITQLNSLFLGGTLFAPSGGGTQSFTGTFDGNVATLALAPPAGMSNAMFLTGTVKLQPDGHTLAFAASGYNDVCWAPIDGGAGIDSWVGTR